MIDVICPYCGHAQEINHNDGYGYEEGVLHQQNCTECDKIFGFETSITFFYDVTPTPCLNGDAPHNYKVTKTWPQRFAKLECTMCGDRKDLPEDHPYLKGDA